MAQAFGVVSVNPPPGLRNCACFLPRVLSMTLSQFRAWIQTEFLYVVWGSNFILLCLHNQVSRPHLLKRPLSLPREDLGGDVRFPPVSGPLACVSLLRKRHAVWCCFVVSLKLGNVNPSNGFFFSKIVLAVPGLLHFHMDFRISFSLCAKKSAGILTRRCLSVYWGSFNFLFFLFLLFFLLTWGHFFPLLFFLRETRTWENNWLVASHTHPDWRSNPQPRYVLTGNPTRSPSVMGRWCSHQPGLTSQGNFFNNVL